MKNWKKASIGALCVMSLLAGCGMQGGKDDGNGGKDDTPMDVTLETLREVNDPCMLLEKYDAVTVNIQGTDRDGEVILKKYSPIGEMSAFAKDYTESLFRSLGHIACIVDRDQVVAASGVNKKELWDKPISHDLEQAIASRQTQTYNRQMGGKVMSVTNEDDNGGYTAQVVSPIIADGEAIGAVLLLSREQGARMGDTEVKVAETAAGIVGRQMEQ